MRKPEQTPEPSIEEILASIRRIIADDAAPAQPPEPAPRPRAVQPTPGEPRSRAADPSPAAPLKAVDKGSEDEILELTEDFMVAETSAMELQEPEEPAGNVYDDPYDDGSGSAAMEPYEELRAAPTGPAAPQQMAPGARHQTSAPGGGLNPALSNVMSEVKRLAEESMPPVESPKPASAVPSEPWGQPQTEAPKPSVPSRAVSSRPVWSARHRETDPAKTRDEVAPQRADRPESLPRKANFSSRDNWSQGVQMPVPEGGPAMPFPYAEAPAARAEPAPATPSGIASPVGSAAPPPLSAKRTEAETPAAQPSADAPAKPRPASQGGQSPLGSMQSKAEKLAEAAVSDFAANRLSAPPVADVLKADKPFMEAITNSLASALSKSAAESGVAEEEAPLLYDLPEEGFAVPQPAAVEPGLKRPSAQEPLLPLTGESVKQSAAVPGAARSSAVPPRTGTASQESAATSSVAAPARAGASPQSGEPAPRRSAPDLPPMPEIGNLEGGFLPSGPDRRHPPTSPDPEMPELPRSEPDDRLAAGAEREKSAHRSNGIVEPPAMPDIAAYPAPYGKANLPAGPIPSTRQPDRVQVQPLGAKSLEESVKDMLKPLLVQWLNENMPRIIKEALREEIVAKGLLPPDERG